MGFVKVSAIAAGSVAVLACAHGQLNSLYFEVSNDISAEQPKATVTIWASFDPGLYAFGHTRFTCDATTDVGGFSDPKVLVDYGDAGQPTEDKDRVLGAGALQLHVPWAGLYADPSNPIPIWQVAWSTDDFLPRRIDLSLTDVSEYFVYTDIGDSGAIDLLDSLVVIPGEIRVVPAPGMGVGALVVIAAARRRRGT